jgi:hypothetical protein
MEEPALTKANARSSRRQADDIEGATLEIIREQIIALHLDLSGLAVVAGTGEGHQSLVASAAVMAGAQKVVALAKPTGATEAAKATTAFATSASVAGRIQIVDHVASWQWQAADIVVNSAQIAPISRSIIELLSPRAVIALMAEPWELAVGALDIAACIGAGIKIAAPNYNHPQLGVHHELAQLCCTLIEEAGAPLGDSLIAVICDTPMAPFLKLALSSRGATVNVFPHPSLLTRNDWDVVVVAMRPSARPPMNINALAHIVETAGEALLVQFSGEVDRSAANYFGLRIWPPKRPGRGQLGLPLHALGPQLPVCKLVAGLKAAESAYRGVRFEDGDIGYMVDAEIWHK